MLWLKQKLFKICAVLIFEVASCTDCLHLVPGNSYLGSLEQSPELSDRAIPNTPFYNPLKLNSETDPLLSGHKNFGLIMPPPIVPDDDTSVGFQTKAFSCSLIPCLQEENESAVCACNFNTGNVVTFKNSCDVKKHNCRFDTSFKVILNEICPWEYESRRSNKQFEIDYNDPKYYNK